MNHPSGVSYTQIFTVLTVGLSTLAPHSLVLGYTPVVHIVPVPGNPVTVVFTVRVEHRTEAVVLDALTAFGGPGHHGGDLHQCLAVFNLRIVAARVLTGIHFNCLAGGGMVEAGNTTC